MLIKLNYHVPSLQPYWSSVQTEKLIFLITKSLPPDLLQLSLKTVHGWVPNGYSEEESFM